MRLWIAVFSLATLCAQDRYRKPPQEVLRILDAPGAPQESLNPTRTHMLILRPRRYPPIREVSQPMLRLAGMRVNPRTNGPHLGVVFTAMSLLEISSGRETKLPLPADPHLSMPRWSPDGKRFALLLTGPEAIRVLIGETDSGKLYLAPDVRVNAAYTGTGLRSGGDTLQWMPDSRRLLVKSVPAGRGPAPPAPDVPVGPNIQESAGKYSPVRTFQDLLTSVHDMDLFDHYMTAQLLMVDTASGKPAPFAEKGIYSTIEPSPDGRYILFHKIQRPYSLLHTAGAFPREIGVWDPNGKVAAKLFSLPLEDGIPIEGVATGPRGVAWRPDEPASLFWVEALDEGNPKRKVDHRDRLMTWKAPFQGQSAEWTRVKNRFTAVDWGKGFALVRDSERERRWVTTTMLSLRDDGAAPKVVFSRSSQDRYRDPGTPMEETLPNGQRVLIQDGDDIFLNGEGATPTGTRPFLDRYNIRTGETKRVFRSGEQGHERVIALLARDGSRLLTERESPTVPQNYFVRTADGNLKALTDYRDPVPELRQVRKQLVKYKRPDGVDLSFTLYLPPGYKEGTRLPTVVWAYPREFTDASVAGQFGGSTERFTTLTGTSHLFFLLAGYAVLDDASMPVVGPPETVNNTYVEQIVSSAKAAIDKAAEMGVTDPRRVGVGGHSYGAFMTANLLAHSDLFRAGIARSGAYNRTLTPFGFQAERRTIWEAPNIYMNMSPFMVADKIKEPLLLIHGEADNNPGTFPIQSDRMYQAVRGNGGTVRLVFLPHESHGYVGRESVEHTLAEMMEWFDKHVKNAQ